MAKAEGLAELKAQVAACEACKLAGTRTQTVFGEGNPEAPLVFVGEGPGQEEDRTGRPFVGRAGQLLDECMAECGITRKHVFICNVVKCRACVVSPESTRNRAPEAEEIQACSRWLERQLSILAPLVIVSLGAPSANALIHPGFMITRERGQWFESCRYAPHAIAALHPAYILRQGGTGNSAARKSLVDDIEAARKKVIEARRAARTTLL